MRFEPANILKLFKYSIFLPLSEIFLSEIFCYNSHRIKNLVCPSHMRNINSRFLVFLQHNHYFESTYDQSYNFKPYEVPKELKHLKGMNLNSYCIDITLSLLNS